MLTATSIRSKAFALRMSSPILAVCIALGVASMPASAAAQAQDGYANATPADKKAAAREFAEGVKAFNEGDYRRAGDTFESAYARVPHHSSLWNAARAWERAGELARAANLYAKFLREAPPNAPDRNSSTRAMVELSAKLGRFDIHASGFEDIKVDEKAIDGTLVYVVPGSHIIEGRSGGKLARQSESVKAGERVSVTMTLPDERPRSDGATTIVPDPPKPTPSSKPLPPWAVYVGGGLTLAAAGVLTWSALDTVNQRKAVDNEPDPARKEKLWAPGVEKQNRTNVLIGVTGGLGLITTVAAIWFVDWDGSSKQKDIQLGFSPGSVQVRGRF